MTYDYNTTLPVFDEPHVFASDLWREVQEDHAKIGVEWEQIVSYCKAHPESKADVVARLHNLASECHGMSGRLHQLANELSN
jgi:hypothetical protein